MKKPLLDVLFKSGKRQKILLLLQGGAIEMKSLLKSIDTTRQALLPQVKVLEEHYLVDHYDDTYELTTIGKLLVDDMKCLIDKSKVFDVDIDYWGTHNLDFIPPPLLKRIQEMEGYEIISPPLVDMYSLHKSFHHVRNTESIYSVRNILYPNYRTIITELIDNNITINYIVSKDLLDKIRTEHYNDFKDFIKSKYFKLYVYNKNMNFLFFTFDDFHIVISPLKKDGDFDSKYILCSTRDVLEWGNDLFDYYLKDSTPVTEI